MLNIWVGNLGKYNEGYLVGEWVELPCSDEEWEAVLERIGINEFYEEWFVPDWECDIPGLKYSEYPDIDEWNEIAEEWETLNEYEQAVVGVLMDNNGMNFDEAMMARDDCIVWEGCDSMADLARRYMDEYYRDVEVPDVFRENFDYESYGRELEIQGTFVHVEGIGYVEVLR